MTEGFQCDKCKRFLPNEMKHRIEKHQTWGGWKTQLTFCSVCYELVLEFIKIPHNYAEGKYIEQYITDLRKAIELTERMWKEKN